MKKSMIAKILPLSPSSVPCGTDLTTCMAYINNSPTATGGLYNISSTKGLTNAFDDYFYPIEGLFSLKSGNMRTFSWEGKNWFLPLF